MEKRITYNYGTGRRKEAVARVKLLPGTGAIVINGKSLEERFPSLKDQQAILKPLQVTETISRYNVMAEVQGGGVCGQSGAISHGLSRALVDADERYKPILRSYGLMTRDARVKERKKPGLRRARKAPQYTKR